MGYDLGPTPIFAVPFCCLFGVGGSTLTFGVWQMLGDVGIRMWKGKKEWKQLKDFNTWQ